MKSSILILGGTAEALVHAKHLITNNADHKIIYSLAGRTKSQPKLNCQIRVGGFGGIAGLASFICENRVVKIIDATHPFAVQISENARQAACKTSIEYHPISRAKWDKQDGDNWIEVSSISQSVIAIPKSSRVFLALGKQHIDAFAKREDCHFVIRMVDDPDMDLNFKSYNIVTGIPNHSIEDEISLLEKHSIEIIVSRNSGGTQSYRKIAAARKMGLPVILIDRPS